MLVILHLFWFAFNLKRFMPKAFSFVFFLNLVVGLLCNPQFVFAQTKSFKPTLSHRISPDRSAPRSFSRPYVLADPIKILAVRVEFQTDDDSKTSGNGLFDGLGYLADYGEDIIDPLPHDKAYFERKLEFLKHYFESASQGKAVINYTVSDSIYTLSKIMSAYSPSKKSDDLTLLAEMVQETWQLVDQLSPEIQFSDYDCFVIFHAGVGRDIDLVSSIGVDPTPFDLPSITFNLNSLQDVFGQSFQGFSVDNGQTLIDHTLILPQTESREIDAIGGDILQEISINGLLCASFGSYLGLPDLFNTSNGRSGIGRFGLMDGEGFFNYYGLLPPAPSAWERIELGWATPKVVELSGETTLSLPALGLDQHPDSVILKIPITSDEYFLVENRQRNPKNAGVTLTQFFKGSTLQITFTKDEDGFASFSIDSLKGDIVTSSNYDWTLPGGEILKENGERIEVQGGILIWHIDENIIRNKRASNGINSGEPKGIRLLEADGSNDIGENYGFTDAGYGSESGTPLDYFYLGNPSPIYENRIDDETYPNTSANSGAKSNLALYGFSSSQAVMEMRLSRETIGIESLDGFPVQLNDEFGPGSAISVYTDDITKAKALLINSDSNNVHLVYSGTPFGLSDALPGGAISSQKAAIGSDGSIYTVLDSTLYWFKGSDTDALNLGNRIITPPVVQGNSIKVGDLSGKVISVSVQGNLLQKQGQEQLTSGEQILGFAGDLVFSDQTVFRGAQQWNCSPYTIHRFAATGKTEGWLGAAITTTNDLIYFFADGSKKITKLSKQDTIKSWPVFADLEHRGELSVIFPIGQTIYAYNEAQFLLSNFPINTRSENPIMATPLIADVDGDTFEDVLMMLPNGTLAVYNRFGKDITSFALSENSQSTPAITTLQNGNLGLFVVDRGGLMQGWRLKTATQNIQWGEQFSGSANLNSYDPKESNGRVELSFQALMPAKRVFNWPNPAREETRFRFYLTEDAKVELSVYDLTGQAVWRKTVQGQAGLDNEVLWNLNSMASGVYYGVVKAIGKSKTEQVKLKIAIVK